MFQKDTFRLIKHSFNRFFTLVMMVTIGVAFMIGLLSTKNIMKTSVDEYNDEYVLHDVQLYSAIGFDDDDIKALRDNEDIEEVFGSKFIDCFCQNSSGRIFVSRISEVDRNINKLKLVSGRMPRNENEIVVLNPSEYFEPDVNATEYTFYQNDSDISELLQNTKYKVVGYVESPEYITFVAGPSTLENRSLDMVCYTLNSNFKADYYSTCYITIKGARELLSYTDEYMDYIKAKLDSLDSFIHASEKLRVDKVLADSIKELEDGEKELEEKKQEGLKELEAAKDKLDSSLVELNKGEKELNDNWKIFYDNEKLLQDSKKELEEQEKQLNEYIKQVEDLDPDGRSFDEIYEQVSAAYSVYVEFKDLLSPSGGDPASDSSLIGIIINRFNAIIDEAKAALIGIADDIVSNIMDGSIEENYENLKKLYDGREALLDGKKKLADGIEELEKGRAKLIEADNTFKGYKKEYEDGYKEYLDGLHTFNTEIEKAEEKIRNGWQQIEDLQKSSWMVLDRDSHYSSYMYKASCDQMGAIGVAMPILFFLVAGLVCMTTMTRLIDEQRGQIGIFGALGFSRLRISLKYVFYAFLASISGGILGVFLGMNIFPVVIYETWRLMYILPPRHIFFTAKVLAICLSSFSILMMGVSFIVANNSLKETPASLLRPKAPKNAKPVFLEKIKFIWNKLSFTSKITARNLIRYKTRFFMTVIGVAGCTALLVVGWGIKDSISDIINVQYGQIFGYDYIVNLQDDKYIEDFELELSKYDDYVTEVVPFMEYNSKLHNGINDNQTMLVQVLNHKDAEDIFKFRTANLKHELKLSQEGVLISSKFAERNNIKKGDFITIESKSGYKAQVLVSDICEMYFQHYIFMSEDYYQKVFDESIHYQKLAVDATDRDILKAIAGKIEGFESLTDFSAMIDTFQNMIGALDIIILVIIITSGALALVVLVNLTQVNISERIREIATLKVLGFRAEEVDSYLFKEIVILSVIGGLAGLPLGVVEHHFIMNVIQVEMVQFGNIIKLHSFIYAFLVTILFTVIVLFFTRKPLRKIQMVESLKSVE